MHPVYSNRFSVRPAASLMSILAGCFLAGAAFAQTPPAWLDDAVKASEAELTALRHELHQMPECTHEELVLAFQNIIDKGREIIKLAQQTIQAYEGDSYRG